MRIPVYEDNRLIVPIDTSQSLSKPYSVTVKVVKPVATIIIKSNGIDFSILSRWALLKMLVLSFF